MTIIMSKKNQKKLLLALSKINPEVYANIKSDDRDFKKLFFQAQSIRKESK